MVSVEDSGLRGGGSALKQKIWDAAKNTISEWTGQELTQCSLYGIRVYYEGSVLAPHVDRLPLVSSAIINVAQDTDEPWPLEVIGHDGRAENVTMEPGKTFRYRYKSRRVHCVADSIHLVYIYRDEKAFDSPLLIILF